MKQAGLLLLLVLELLLFNLLGGQPFHSAGGAMHYFASYLSDLLTQSTPELLLAFGMTWILMTGGIDLSVASMVALIAGVMGCFPGGPGFWWTAIPVGLALGLVLGAVNGGLIAFFDVPPIIATLGTMIFYRGLCFAVLGDNAVEPFLSVPGYGVFGQLAGAGILLGIIYLLGSAAFLRSRWRQELLMFGGNPIAARYAGIPVTRRILEVYTAMGALAFLAALCFSARNGAVSGSSLTGMELQVIVAVVLGGTRVQGGQGSLSGSFLGVILIAALDEGLRGAAIWGDRHLPFRISDLEFIFLGFLLVMGVWLNAKLQARRTARGGARHDSA